MSKVRDMFFREKTYVMWFWISVGIVFTIDLFWFFPSTRALPIVRFLEHVFLQHAFSPLELIHQIVITFMIFLVWHSRNQGYLRGFEVFRISFFLLLILVFIEELAWGHNFVDFAWPDSVAPFFGRHEDVHNVMIGGADVSDLLEAMAALFTCVLLARPIKSKLPLIPSLPLTKSAFKMLTFSFMMSPLSMIKEVNEQDLIFETAIFSSLSMGIMAGIGKLQASTAQWEDQTTNHRLLLWLLAPLPWIKFFYLVSFGHYQMFSASP